MYFWKYILAKKAGLSQQKCNMALYGLPVLPIAEAFEKTVTGNPITITDAIVEDALSLQVAFTPTQDGTPSIDSEPTTEPYLSKVIPRGNKEYYSLVGATVAWNQLTKNDRPTEVAAGGITFTNNGDGSFTADGNASSNCYFYSDYISNIKIQKNHVYYYRGCPSGGSMSTYRLGLTINGSTAQSDVGGGRIYKHTGAAEGYISTVIYIYSRYTANNLVFKPQIHDLTLMFANNPAIADYAYSLEQSEAGSGIAWLKSYGFFTKDYYPYNPGELISVSTSGHKIGSTTYPIDPTDLRGLFKLSNGKLYCEGDTYKSDGTVTRKYGIVDLGELNWGRSTTGVEGQYRFTSSGIASAVKIVASNISANIITAKYVTVKGDTGWATEIDKAVWTDHLGVINIIDKSYTDKDTFKAAMDGVYLAYELATPTTETATPYTSPIVVEQGGTEEFIDDRTVPVPVGNETYYAAEYAINGKTSVTVSHGATVDDPNPTEYEVQFTSQGTVYGGTVDIVTGELTVTWGYIASYNGEALTGEWMSSKDVYAVGTTPSTGAEVAYELATPQTYNLTPEQVTMLLGSNYLETEDGTITLTYMAGK